MTAIGSLHPFAFQEHIIMVRPTDIVEAGVPRKAGHVPSGVHLRARVSTDYIHTDIDLSQI